MMLGGVQYYLKVTQSVSLLIVSLKLSLQECTQAAAGGKLLNAANKPFPGHLPPHVTCTQSLWGRC